MSTPSEREARNARVDQAVAEDVAVGMAAKADQEANRADLLAAQNARQGVNLDRTRAERDAAAFQGAVAREQARNSAFGFWLLLGVVAVALLIGAIWYANRPEPATAPAVTIQRNTAPAPAVMGGATRNPAPPVAVTPAPAPAAPPVVVEKRVIIERPVAVPVPVPVERPAARQPGATIVVQPAAPAATEAGGAATTEGARDGGAKTESGPTGVSTVGAPAACSEPG